MRVELFDYDLPPERIALTPATPREAARMLVVGADGHLLDSRVGDLPDFLRPGDAVVVNDTRVIPARLRGTRVRGAAIARIEAMLIRRIDESHWRTLARPTKKLRTGDHVRFGDPSDASVCVDAEVDAKGEGGEIILKFALSGSALNAAIERIGETPLPPYIASRRSATPEDRAAYQTVFAAESGAVAAPTAGLHFTPDLIGRIEAVGACLHRVTLHVGAGTFLPVKADDTADHVMHSEWGRLDSATARALNRARERGRIVAIGTTSLRLLESAADSEGVFRPFEGETSIFITPGYAFKAVDVLFTNFHLPRSTLLMLVSAFSGRPAIRATYDHAIASGYRFYSYGDACLLYRAAPNASFPPLSGGRATD